ncbi:diguanylate cyclase domain-containing protein [Cupriavidus numazuensis]|uniref:Diguanylate cyclase n=1 Tax=Cupriavidus numazuensis TaxID=221992 RepID=A0ABN7QCQ8_9BURK|nr:diguanylate cyclase [Cupriavidus numazuensis]CAG2160492.1 hypothetical protein LMG26411_07521 [Cupriavidus numazuensis]
MKTHLRTIRYGVIRAMAFAVLIAVMLIVSGVYLLAEFDKLVNGIYVQNTLPVSGLGEVRATAIDARRRLWKILAMRQQPADSSVVEEIRKEMARMDQGWQVYLPTGISSDKEQQLADELGQQLPVFRALMTRVAAQVADGDYDAAQKDLDHNITFLQQLDALFGGIVSVNVRQAEVRASTSTSMFNRMLWVAGVISASGVLAFLWMSLYLVRQRDDALRKSFYSQWLVDQAFELTQDGVMITDANGVIEKVNPAFSRLTGYGQSELIGNTPRLFSSGRQPAEFYRDLWRALKEQGQWRGELWNRRKDGAVYRESLSICGIRGVSGAYSNYVAVCSDITQRQQQEERLGFLATHDALTGLPNRTLLGERLSQAVARARRASSHVAVMFLDLDGFKVINDTLGHGVGDETLIAVAHRLKEALREADTVARLGGDEFAMVLEDVADQQCVAPIAEMLLRVVAGVNQVHGHPVFVTPSIGISMFPDDAADPAALLARADESMYAAKRSGKNAFRFYSAARDTKVLPEAA